MNSQTQKDIESQELVATMEKKLNSQTVVTKKELDSFCDYIEGKLEKREKLPDLEYCMFLLADKELRNGLLFKSKDKEFLGTLKLFEKVLPPDTYSHIFSGFASEIPGRLKRLGYELPEASPLSEADSGTSESAPFYFYLPHEKKTEINGGMVIIFTLIIAFFIGLVAYNVNPYADGGPFFQRLGGGFGFALGLLLLGGIPSAIAARYIQKWWIVFLGLSVFIVIFHIYFFLNERAYLQEEEKKCDEKYSYSEMMVECKKEVYGIFKEIEPEE